MTLDSDLLDLHLHATEITARGIRELAETIQGERNMYRQAFARVLDQIEDKAPQSTQQVHEAMTAIQTELNELEWRASLSVIRWRELDG